MTAVELAQRPTLTVPEAWSFPAFERTEIADGLTVLHRHLPGQGLISAALLLDAGITAEPRELAGLARLTGDALDEGTTRHDADGFAAALDRAGAILSVDAQVGGMTVATSAPPGGFADALALLADAVREPTFPQREVARLQRQRLDAIAQQLARPASRAQIAAAEAMIAADHRCSLPGGGTPATVARIDRDAVTAFHADRIATSPATLVVAGDLTGLDVPTLAHRLLADRDAGREAASPQPLAVRAGPRLTIVDKPEAVQTQLIIGRIGLDRHAPDWAALRVAGYVLGGTLTSRLDAVLREERGYTYGIRTRLPTYRRGGLVHAVTGSVHTEVTEAAVTEALTIMRRLTDNGVTADERDDTVAYLVGVTPLRLETAEAIVADVVHNLSDDLAAEQTGAELGALRSVTVDEASEAAATHLRTDDLVVVAVGDADHIAPALQAATGLTPHTA